MRKVIIFVSTCFLLAACVTTPFRTPISQSFIDSKEPISVYLVFDQEEIDADIPIQNNSAAAYQYGLLGVALVGAMDNAANKSNSEIAEENLAPIRNALIEYDFNQLFEKNARESLNNLESLNVAELVRVNSIEEFEELKKALPTEQKYLTLNVHYKLDTNFTLPYVKLDAELVDKSILDKKQRTLYRNRFTSYGETKPIPTISQEEIKEKVDKVKGDFFALSRNERKSYKAREKYFKDLKKAEKQQFSRSEFIGKLSLSWTQGSQELANSLQDSFSELLSILGKDMIDINSTEHYQTIANSLNKHPTNFKSTLVYETNDRLAVRTSMPFNSGKICVYEKAESIIYQSCN